MDEPLYKLVVLDKDGSSKINFDINGVVINLRSAPKHDPLFGLNPHIVRHLKEKMSHPLILNK